MTVNVVEAGPRQISRSVEVDASAVELFAMAADPRRHCELDGSGTVRDNVKAPDQISVGSKFSTNMKMYGFPYRIRSTVTALQPDELVEWRHPEGHRWRWEFKALSPKKTLVTETFDYRDAGALKRGFYALTGSIKGNAVGIEKSLTKLRDRYAASSG